MQYRRMGRTGLKLSVLSFGSWVTFHNQLDEERAAACMKAAYDAGVNFFDNAEAYADGESERIMGRVLRKLEWGRDSYCVSSKAFWGGKLPTQRGLSRKHLHDACHAALRRLNVDYLDLFFCHRPDPETPIEETVRAMNSLIRQGKVLYWGTSEWDADQIMQACGIARELSLDPPAMEQPQYNMLHRDRVETEYRNLYEAVGLGTTVWSPLASGILTGKYKDGVLQGSRFSLPEYGWLAEELVSETGRRNLRKVAALEPVARDLGATQAQLAIAWCLKNPHVSTVILGASKVSQLEENLAALQWIDQLGSEVMKRIEEILQNQPTRPSVD